MQQDEASSITLDPTLSAAGLGLFQDQCFQINQRNTSKVCVEMCISVCSWMCVCIPLDCSRSVSFRVQSISIWSCLFRLRNRVISSGCSQCKHTTQLDYTETDHQTPPTLSKFLHSKKSLINLIMKLALLSPLLLHFPYTWIWNLIIHNVDCNPFFDFWNCWEVQRLTQTQNVNCNAPARPFQASMTMKTKDRE